LALALDADPGYDLLQAFCRSTEGMSNTGFNLLEFPGIHIEAVQPPVPAPVTSIDYSEEAVVYEKKLVQVTAYLLTGK